MTEGLRKIGESVWFEYHCEESPQSQDAELWYRSHQKVTIIAIADNDGMQLSKKEREDFGQPIVYDVEFKDGFIGTVFEDELLNSKKKFIRPNPPKKNKKVY